MASTPTDGHLQAPGLLESTLRVKNVPGYTTPVFKGKEEQKAKVLANVTSKVSFYIPLCCPMQRTWAGGFGGLGLDAN